MVLGDFFPPQRGYGTQVDNRWSNSLCWLWFWCVSTRVCQQSVSETFSLGSEERLQSGKTQRRHHQAPRLGCCHYVRARQLSSNSAWAKQGQGLLKVKQFINRIKVITHLILEEFLDLRSVPFNRKRYWIEMKMVVLCMFMSYQRMKALVFVCGNTK